MTQPKPPTRDTELSQHTPVCVPCERNYRCELNGILVRLGPDATIDADLYKCPGCGHQIVRGFAREAIERYGPHQAQFEASDARMENATITEHTGRPVTQPVVEREARDLDKTQDAAEYAAER